MTRKSFLLIAAATLLFGCAPVSTPPPHQASTEQKPPVVVGKVTKVIDGDTLEIIESGVSTRRIRLKGIDAPERNQAFAIESTRSLARLTNGKEVIIEWEKIDEHDRLVGRVLIEKRDICLEQIRAGMAWHFKRYQHEQTARERELYDRSENEARSARKGLWADSKPLEPWVVRTGQRDFRPEISEKQPAIIQPPEPQPNTQAVAQTEVIRGNRRSMIYHWPGCPNYDDIAMHNRVPFASRAEAERAGYRAARNCH